MGGAATATSNAGFVPAPPSFAGDPAVTGTAEPGAALACDHGPMLGAADGFAYSWLRDDVPIAAAASTYVVQAGDAGHALRCRVTARSAGGETARTSAAVPRARDHGGTGPARRDGTLAVALGACPATETRCTGRVTLTTGTTTLATARFDVRGGAAARLRRTPTRAGRRLLAGRAEVTVAVAVVTRDAAGNAATVRRRVTLRRPGAVATVRRRVTLRRPGAVATVRRRVTLRRPGAPRA